MSEKNNKAARPPMSPKDLAEILLETLQNLSGSGQKATPENLAKWFSFNPSLAALFDTDENAADSPEPASPAPDQANSLKQHIDALTRQVAEEKEQVLKEEAFFRRALLTIVRLAMTPRNKNLEKVLSSFKQGLSADGSFDELRDAMGFVKDEILKIQMDGQRDKAKTGDDEPEDFDPDILLHEVDSRWIPEIKHLYLELLSNMDLDLGQDYLDDLAKLRKSITMEQDLESLLNQRPRIESLTHRFAQYFYDEKNKAAEFIGEIASHLTDMEKNVETSLGRVKKIRQISNSFQSALGSQMTEMKDSSQKSSNIEELRNVVLTKLQTIGKLIDKKQDQDSESGKLLDKDFQALKDEVEKAKAEASRVQEENRIMAEKIRYDTLTGAYNRFAHDENLELEMKRFLRHNRTFSLIVFDIDNFKGVNDRHGHAVGDRCLQETVNNVKPLLRQTDFLARYGGDEFVAVLPETSLDHGVEVAEKIRKQIEQTEFMVRGQAMPVTVTAGVAEVAASDQNARLVFERADKALYKAKNSGRNKVLSG